MTRDMGYIWHRSMGHVTTVSACCKRAKGVDLSLPAHLPHRKLVVTYPKTDNNYEVLLSLLYTQSMFTCWFSMITYRKTRMSQIVVVVVGSP